MKEESKKELQTIKDELFNQLIESEDGNYFITFRYMLPFRIPFEDETQIVLGKFMFLFLQKEYEYHALSDGFGDLPHFHTILEVTIKLKRENYTAIEHDLKRRLQVSKSINDSFDEQLEEVNKLLNIINVKYQFLTVQSVHRGELIGTTSYKLYKFRESLIEDKDTDGLIVYKKSNQIEDEKYKNIEDEDIQFITDCFSELGTNPYLNITLIARKGEKAYELYDFNNAIVHYNTVFEVVIIRFITEGNLMLKMKNEEETENLLKAGFQNLARKHFSDVLDELQLSDAKIIKKIIDKYMDTVYKYRNSIVHKAASYSEKEAFEALKLVRDLTYMINDNMCKAESNPFVDYYTKYNQNSSTKKYDSVKQKYQ